MGKYRFVTTKLELGARRFGFSILLCKAAYLIEVGRVRVCIFSTWMKAALHSVMTSG